jgi:acetyltransferase-like isoleucine patch superfamily enzyme
MKNYIKFLRKFSLKSIYFNLKYLPFKQAIRFPILISSKVSLRKVSGKIIFNCPIKTGLIQIGFDKVGIFDHKYSRSIWEVYGTVIFNGNAIIGHGSRICVLDGGTLTIGNNFSITAESSIITSTEVSIGNDCLISWDVLIMDTDFHKILDENDAVINPPQSITIGNKVWIGCRSLVLKGSAIPNNCIIGANSVLSTSLLNENSLYAGIPTRYIKDKIKWRL